MNGGNMIVINARNTTHAYDQVIRYVWWNGKVFVDQRKNKIKEVENITIQILSDTIDYPNFGPTTKRYGIDFAAGLTDDNEAYEKFVAFQYSYGERIRRDNALENVIDLLTTEPTTRRAVLPIFLPNDTKYSQHEVPCATQIYLRVRDGKLNMDLHMRSNDIVGAFPADVYGFRRLQEYIAVEIGCKIGIYTHTIGSAHIILDNNEDFVKAHIKNPTVWY